MYNVADLHTKVKAIEQEKASLLTVMELLQAICYDPKVDECKKCDTLTPEGKHHSGKTRETS